VPAGDSTSVDVIGVGQARSQFENTASAFAEQLGQVVDEVTLLHSTWMGGESLEFGSAVDDWENSLSTVIEELRAVVAAMGGTPASTVGQADDAGGPPDRNG